MSASSAFGKLNLAYSYAGDKTQITKNKLLFCNCKKSLINNSSQYLTKRTIQSLCCCGVLYDRNNLVPGGFLPVDLSGVTVLTDVSGSVPVVLNPNIPFYENYNIDPSANYCSKRR